MSRLSQTDVGALFDRYGDTIYRYARARLPPADAEDVTSEVFVVASRRTDVVPGNSRAWLLGIARKVVATHVRAERRRRSLRSRLGALPAPEVHEPGEELLGLDRLRRALARLTERDREVIILMATEELTSEELAEALGCRPGAAAVRLHRARRRFRAALGAEPLPAEPSATCSTGARDDE